MADGRTRTAFESDIQPGTVLREINFDGTVPPFGDNLVVRVAMEHGEKYVHLERPYIIVDKYGETRLRKEKYSVALDRITCPSGRLKLVIMDRGNAAVFCY